MLFWDVFYPEGFKGPRIVLTIHNMDNSGECRQDEFAATGVAGVIRVCAFQSPQSVHFGDSIIVISCRYVHTSGFLGGWDGCKPMFDGLLHPTTTVKVFEIFQLL
jgi:hypothetical protein